MITEEELRSVYGLADNDIDELKTSAEAYESGEWPEGVVTRIGRPSMYSEPMRAVPFRLGITKIAKLDAKAKELGVTRSEAMRKAVDLWLATA